MNIETRFIDEYDELKWLYSQSYIKIYNCYYNPYIKMYVVYMGYK